jgi:hypothetical protein
MITNEYAAGFFDGEGNISIASTGKKAYELNLRVIIGQKDFTPLLKFKEKWGGSVDYGRQSKVYFWRGGAKIAEKFLRDVLPFLIVKKAQAEIALDFRDKCFPKRMLGRNKEFMEGIAELRNNYKQQVSSRNAKMGFAARGE